MTSSLFFYTFLFGILTSLNTFALGTSSSKTHVVYASSADSAARLSFISLKDKPAIACRFQLYYKKVLFNNNSSEVFSAKYSKDKHLRTQILAETLFGYFVVSLQIQNINLLDAGVYWCNLSCGQNIVQYIYLKVYYPPSAANCTWENEQRVPLEMVKFLDYSILQCTATRGYPEGGIICYSQLQDTTKAHSPYHISGHNKIKATFWLRKELPLNCCSVNEHLIKVEEVCDDFVSYTKVSSEVTYTHKDKFLSKARSEIQVDILSFTPANQTVNPNFKDSTSSRSGNFTSTSELHDDNKQLMFILLIASFVCNISLVITIMVMYVKIKDKVF